MTILKLKVKIHVGYRRKPKQISSTFIEKVVKSPAKSGRRIGLIRHL